MKGTCITKVNIDFIIPTLNEEDNIPLLISSILEQEIPEWIKISNIIVVDNGSKDRTLELANKYGASVYLKPNLSIADLRNFGANIANGNIIIFSDADNVLRKDVVSCVVSILAANPLAALGPDGLIPYGNSTWLQNIWYYHTRVLKENNETLEVENLSSGFFAIWSKIFREIGGFNGSLSIGEDSEISKRLTKSGYRLLKSNKVIVYNTGHPKNIQDFMKREFWHGDSFKHLIIHRNIDLLTVYFFVNLILWINLIFSLFFFRSTLFFVLNLTLILIIPLYKAFKKENGINIKLIKLFFVYTLYSISRSLALLKI